MRITRDLLYHNHNRSHDARRQDTTNRDQDNADGALLLRCQSKVVGAHRQSLDRNQRVLVGKELDVDGAAVRRGAVGLGIRCERIQAAGMGRVFDPRRCARALHDRAIGRQVLDDRARAATAAIAAAPARVGRCRTVQIPTRCEHATGTARGARCRTADVVAVRLGVSDGCPGEGGRCVCRKRNAQRRRTPRHRVLSIVREPTRVEAICVPADGNHRCLHREGVSAYGPPRRPLRHARRAEAVNGFVVRRHILCSVVVRSKDNDANNNHHWPTDHEEAKAAEDGAHAVPSCLKYFTRIEQHMMMGAFLFLSQVVKRCPSEMCCCSFRAVSSG
jgi:hypothetical protein